MFRCVLREGWEKWVSRDDLVYQSMGRSAIVEMGSEEAMRAFTVVRSGSEGFDLD